MSRRSKIKELEQEIENLRKEKENLQKVVNGEKHMTGAHCTSCANLVEVEEYTPFVGKHKVKYCKLDFNCKDRVENEQ
jgi:hypothetical protein